MKCKVCNRYIRFDEVTSFTCGFKCKIYNLLGMICSVLGVILSVFYLDYIGFDSNQVIICLGLGFIITFCTFTATIFSINLLINKEVIIEGIRSTGL